MAEPGSPVGSSSFRWQIALALGLPVAVGVGYWYLNSKGSGDKISKLANKNNTCREISIDGEAPTKVTAEPRKKVCQADNIICLLLAVGCGVSR